MTLTPLHLKLLLHYFTTPDPWPQAFAPSVIRFTDELARLGLVLCLTSGYEVTPKGAAYIRALCTTPMPDARWTLPAQEERAL